MKRTILLSYIALLTAIMLAIGSAEKSEDPAKPVQTLTRTETVQSTASPLPKAPQTIAVLSGGETRQTDMQAYLVGVVAAEMPASFPEEALKAQAVAARTYAMYCAKSGKHDEGGVCTESTCCQAWKSADELKLVWGEDYDKNLSRICHAVQETENEYLSYKGEAVFAAFHSSSAGATEDCGAIWNALPYLVSVESPERADTVPDYVSRVECTPLDFRDTLLYAQPSADFTGEQSTWIGQMARDKSGRVAFAILGGAEYKGTLLRELFKLRSTAFELEYNGSSFVFTVTGFGHGVGMSQYGAKTLAESGEDYAHILAHYYPGTILES